MQDITHHYNSDAILLDTAVDALLSLAHHHDDGSADLSRRRVMTEYTIPTDRNHCNSNSSSHSTNPFVKINIKKRKKSFTMDVNSHRTTTSTNSTGSLLQHHPGSKVSFPMEIFHVLNQKEVEHIVSWTPDGTSFVIHNMQIFQSYILPHYFNGIKFDSFQRKLYRWGFTKNLSYKLKGGEYDMDDPLSSSAAVSPSRKTNAVIWSNALFQRNKPYLCHEMTCTTGTSNHTSSSSSSPTTTTSTTATLTTATHSVHHEDHHHYKKRRNKHHYSHGKHAIVTATTTSSSSSHGDVSPIISTTTTSSSWQQPQ